MNQLELWSKFQKYHLRSLAHGLSIDISRVNFSAPELNILSDKVTKAIDAMRGLEAGDISNPDENRMVGHYWLRAANLAPNADIREQIQSTLSAIKNFAADVHSARISPAPGGKFENLLVVGIGGSALGPQFVSQALGNARNKMALHFFDNTDPDGMQNVLSTIPSLEMTLCLVISKSGGTKETRNGQLIAKAAFTAAGLKFNQHFVAVTGDGSELDKVAVAEKWLARFPMWDWVGGRTSELSAVGLLPAALQGFDIDQLLRGASEMDQWTREKTPLKNPAAMLAMMWHYCGQGKGSKDMVVLPYKDRLELFSRYLQQLVMESLGKEKDLSGAVVNQGISVFGNKGSTDQHAYVQQLREGLNNFFAIFIEVLKDSSSITAESEPKAANFEVEPGVTAGDYLSGFYLGTRSALYENQRESITITIDEVSAYSVGQLIALFERAVGLYAHMVNINAYHQPGVEAGKKAAQRVLDIQKKVVTYFESQNLPQSVSFIAEAIAENDSTETVFKILQHLVANGRLKQNSGANLFEATYLRV